MILRKKKILFFLPDLSGGGAQRVVSTLTFGLSDLYEVFLVLNDSSISNFPCKAKLIDIKAPANKKIILKIFFFIKRIFWLKSIKKKLKPLATISFLESSNIINILSMGKGKKIVSVRSHISKHSDNYLRFFKNIHIKYLYNLSDFVVVNSIGAKMDLIDSFNVIEDKIKVIYNPCNYEDIESMTKEDIEDDLRPFFDGPILITVGRLAKAKGQWHLIRSFKDVIKNVPDLKLLIIGQGELKAYLESLIKEADLTNHIKIMGFRDNPYKYLAKSKLFVLTSLFEGFPNVLCEAMACGIPTISSDCRSGPREILAPDTEPDFEAIGIEYAKYGVLTPVCDGYCYSWDDPLTDQERELSKAITELYYNKEKIEYYRKAGKERVKSFVLKEIASEWTSLIEA